MLTIRCQSGSIRQSVFHIELIKLQNSLVTEIFSTGSCPCCPATSVCGELCWRKGKSESEMFLQYSCSRSVYGYCSQFDGFIYWGNIFDLPGSSKGMNRFEPCICWCDRQHWIEVVYMEDRWIEKNESCEFLSWHCSDLYCSCSKWLYVGWADLSMFAIYLLKIWSHLWWLCLWVRWIVSLSNGWTAPWSQICVVCLRKSS